MKKTLNQKELYVAPNSREFNVRVQHCFATSPSMTEEYGSKDGNDWFTTE